MIILDGKPHDVPGIPTVNWLETPRCPRATDYSPRRQWTRAIVLHTVHGRKGPVRPGGRDTGRDLAYARYQAGTPRDVSWDFTIDTDGSVAQSNDPVGYYTWHATTVNPLTVGIEFVQETDGAMYEDQLRAGAVFVAWLCDALGIQKQIPWVQGAPVVGTVRRISVGRGVDVCGVYGHRNQTSQKGPGDPGDGIFHALKALGFEGFNFDADEDKAAWRVRQEELGVPEAKRDGVPGPGTRRLLAERGYRAGVWLNGRTPSSGSGP